MNTTEVLLHCKALVERTRRRANRHGAATKIKPVEITKATFLDFADEARDAILNTPPKAMERLGVAEYVKDLALGLRKLRDDFEMIATRDPMCLYTPRHAVSLAFHRSMARVRYFHAGNRTSKTESGKAEVYWCLTNRHPYRKPPPQPVQVFIVGVNFTQYAETVFIPKYITGEQGNPLSPAFPEKGKWFHRYNEKTHTLELACPECAEKGKAGSCPHPKRRLILFSDEAGAAVLGGGQYGLGQFDEQIERPIYREGRERIKTVPNAGLIVTETPLNGRGWWTWTELAVQADRGDLIPGTKIPVVERFNISQFDAGLVPHEEILASMQGMEEHEIQARIYGQPVLDSDKAVFDLVTLAKMHSELLDPRRAQLMLPDGPWKTPEQYLAEAPAEATTETQPRFEESEDGLLRIWESPLAAAQYVIGVDVAHGLTKRDASCADVFKLVPVGTTDLVLEQVAQYHGWINPLLYAEELFKLGLYYGLAQRAWLVVERNGPGMSLIQRLNDLGCWFMFRDVASTAAVRYTMETQYGIDTNVRSKSIIIAAAQSAIRARRYGRPGVIFRCRETMTEFENYAQEVSESGLTIRFAAAAAKSARSGPDSESGAGHDDRVMSAALAIYAARTYPLFDYDLHRKLTTVQPLPSSGQRLMVEDWLTEPESEFEDAYLDDAYGE